VAGMWVVTEYKGMWRYYIIFLSVAGKLGLERTRAQFRPVNNYMFY